jgi:hypothetical protein
MSNLLKFLMQQHRYMAPKDDEGGASGGGTDDPDLDDDLDEDPPPAKEEKQAPAAEPVDDGSVEIVLEGEEGDQQGADDTQQQGETDEDREKIREARRKERQDRKQRQKEREESTKRELAAERNARKELEARLAAIEGKDRSREIATLDENIKRTANQYNYQKEQLRIAHEQHDGAAAAEATEKMIAARDTFQQLSNVKKTVEQSSNQQPNQNLDPRLVHNAQKFMEEHSWYKPGTPDRDTRILKAVDDELAAEGWNPTTSEYWDELRARVKKFLPHRVAGGKVPATDQTSGQQQPAQRRNTVAAGGESSTPASSNTFKLSKERVDALKEAGLWDDPKARNEAVKRYREYDKQNAKG